MTTDRRGFLKLVGLGAATAGSGVFTGLAADMLINAPIGEHLVFYDHDPVLLPDATAWYVFKSDFGYSEDNPGLASWDVITMENPKRVPWRVTDVVTGQVRMMPPRPWKPHGIPVEYQVDVPVGKEDDPHTAFYMAAENLRDHISADTAKLAMGLATAATGKAMITVVHMPVMAVPHPESGFYLHTQIEQYACDPKDIMNPDEAESKCGEVPVETPNDIEFKYLLHLDEELKTMGFLEEQPSKVKRRHALHEARRRIERRRLSGLDV